MTFCFFRKMYPLTPSRDAWREGEDQAGQPHHSSHLTPQQTRHSSSAPGISGHP